MAQMPTQNALQGALQTQQGNPMPQQQNVPQGLSGAPVDPTVPTSTEGFNSRLATYKARRDALMNDTQQVVTAKDPFAVSGPIHEDTQQKTQKDLWLASTAVAAKPVSTFNQQEHENFMEHWNNDPAVKEVEDSGAWEVVDTLAEMVKRGDLSYDDAVAQLQSDGFISQMDNIINKHHKNSNNPHSMTTHPSITGRGNPLPQLNNTINPSLTNKGGSK